jgi:hypothetical protein
MKQFPLNIYISNGFAYPLWMMNQTNDVLQPPPLIRVDEYIPQDEIESEIPELESGDLLHIPIDEREMYYEEPVDNRITITPDMEIMIIIDGIIIKKTKM